MGHTFLISLISSSIFSSLTLILLNWKFKGGGMSEKRYRLEYMKMKQKLIKSEKGKPICEDIDTPKTLEQNKRDKEFAQLLLKQNK